MTAPVVLVPTDPHMRAFLRCLRGVPDATLPELEEAAGLPPLAGLLALGRLLERGQIASASARPCGVTGVVVEVWALVGEDRGTIAAKNRRVRHRS